MQDLKDQRATMRAELQAQREENRKQREENRALEKSRSEIYGLRRESRQHTNDIIQGVIGLGAYNPTDVPVSKLPNKELFNKIVELGASLQKNKEDSLAKTDQISAINELSHRVTLNPHLRRSIPSEVKEALKNRSSQLEESIKENSSSPRSRDRDVAGVSADIAKWDCERIEAISNILGEKLPSQPFVTAATMFINAASKRLTDAKEDRANPTNSAELVKFSVQDARLLLEKVGIELRPFGEKTLKDWLDEANTIIQKNESR